MGLPASPYNLSFLFDHVYMIGGVTHLGGLPGLSGRVALSAGVAFCHVNDSRWGKPPSRGRDAARADNERKRTLTAKIRRSFAIFSVYMPSDHAATSSNVTPGPRGCKFACKRRPVFDHG